VPWRRPTLDAALKGKKRFVLGASGHIAGVINPPAKGKRSHWSTTSCRPGRGLVRRRHRTPGQLVDRLVGWLKPLGGKLVAAPKAPGNRKPQGHRTRARPLRQGQGLTPFHSQETFPMTDIVIVAAARTAVGKFGGTLAKTPAPSSAPPSSRRCSSAPARRRAGRRGHPGPGAAGRQRPEPGAPGRHQVRPAARRAGDDHQQGLRLGPEGRDAGGAGHPRRRQRDRHRRRPGEHERCRPHVLQGSRDGQRMGDWKMVDSMIVDGLWDVYNQYHMGITAENVAKQHGITPRGSRTRWRWPASRRPPRRRTPAASRTRSCRCDPAEEGRPGGVRGRRVHQPQDQRRGLAGLRPPSTRPAA
jgi:hypothetical protein